MTIRDRAEEQWKAQQAREVNELRKNDLSFIKERHTFWTYLAAIMATALFLLALVASCTAYTTSNNQTELEKVKACVDSGGSWVPTPVNNDVFQCVHK